MCTRVLQVLVLDPSSSIQTPICTSHTYIHEHRGLLCGFISYVFDIVVAVLCILSSRIQIIPVLAHILTNFGKHHSSKRKYIIADHIFADF